MLSPIDLPTLEPEPPLESLEKDSDLPAYRYARALAETARSASSDRIKGFKRNWEFLLGRNQWAKPASSSAAALDQWSFRGVVNWLFATVKTKAAMIVGASSDIVCDPLDDQSSYFDRLLVKSSIEHELERVHFRQVKEDAYLWGSTCGVGIAMWTARPDQLTGTMALNLGAVKASEFYRDPSADSITSKECRFVVWDPELDMSTVRQMWPSKAHKVKPEIRQVTGGFTYKPDKTDDNLIYGTSGEFVVDQQNVLRSRKAKVTFVWIRDESVVEDLHSVIIKEAQPGIQCVSCDSIHEASEELSTESPCPVCGGDMQPVEIPAQTEQNRIFRRAYPYGRLIVYSGETLLYDGENPYEIETVFPFAVYHHDRIPGDFYGSNDVAMLESLQDAQNRTVGELIDYVRLGVNGPFEYAVGCKSYTDMGNGPAERHPVPDHLFGKARFVTPDGFNVQAWSALHSALDMHFQIVGGLGSIGFSQTSSPPISATEAELANARLSDRMKGHAQGFSDFCSEVASIGYQMMKQFYSAPMTIPVTMPDSEIKSIAVEVQKLPKVNVRVVVAAEQTAKDKLMGQNVAGFAASGGMESPYADIVLESFGLAPARIKELMQRRALQQELGVPTSPMMPEPTGGGVPNAQLLAP